MKRLLQKKYFRYSLIVIASLFFLLLLAYIVASFYVHSHKERIISKIKEGVHATINGEVSIDDIDISLFSSFPYIGGVISGIAINDSLGHPTFSAQSTSIRISIFQLTSSNPNVAKVIVSNGTFHLFTDSTGYTNKYVFEKNGKKSEADEKRQAPKIKGLSLKNVHVIFEDELKSKKIDILCRSLDAHIKQHDSIISVRMDDDFLIHGLGFNLEKGSFLANKNLSAKRWSLSINTAAGEVSFKDEKIKIDDQLYNITAKFHLKGEGWFQLHVTADQLKYEKAAALLTKNIESKLRHVAFSGPLKVKAALNGSLAPGTQPVVNVQFETSNNNFTTPLITFQNSSFSGHYINQVKDSLPVSDRNSEILLRKFNSSWGDISLKTDSILMTDLINPNIRFNFSSKVDFQTLNDQLELETVQFSGGSADVTLQYDGPLITTIELMNGITSSVFLKDATVQYVPRNITFTHATGFISFSSNDLEIKNLQCDIGANKFVVNLIGSDLNHIASGDLGKSNINCEVFSPSINLDDFKSIFNTKQTAKTTTATGKKTSGFSTVTSKIDDVLKNGNLALTVKSNNVSLGHFTASNVQTSLLFKSEGWQIKNAALHHAGGLLKLSASVIPQRNGFHAADASVDLDNVDVKRLFYAFDNFGQDGITYNNIRGIINSSGNIKVRLNKNGDIVPGSIDGNVYFSLKRGALIDFLPLKELNEIALLNRDFSHITFAELKDSLVIKDNQIFIRRMEIASSAIHMFVEGVYGINKPTDILMEIPISNLRMREENFVPENKGVDAKLGPSIRVRATAPAGERVKIKVELFKRKRKK